MMIRYAVAAAVPNCVFLQQLEANEVAARAGGAAIGTPTPAGSCICSWRGSRRRRSMTMTKKTSCCSLSSSSSSPLPSDADADDSVSSSSSSMRKSHTPKPGQFSMSKIEFNLKNPPFIERTRNELADYCGRLEGDECYSCWDAYLELRYLQKECPKEEVENLIIEAEGLKALVWRLHRRTAFVKFLKQMEADGRTEAAHASTIEEPKPTPDQAAAFDDRHIPDGIPLPESNEGVGVDQGMMDDSQYTKMLRVVARGGYPTHYDPAES